MDSNSVVYTLVDINGKEEVKGDLLSLHYWIFKPLDDRGYFIKKALNYTWVNREDVVALVCRVEGEELYVLSPELTRIFLCHLSLLS